MKFLSVREFATRENLPERTGRNYCSTGRIKIAFLTGKTWNIPEDAAIIKKQKINLAGIPCLAIYRSSRALN